MLDTAYKYTYGNKEERRYILEAARATESCSYIERLSPTVLPPTAAQTYLVLLVIWSESETVHIHTYRILSRYVSNYPLIVLIWIRIAGL